MPVVPGSDGAVTSAETASSTADAIGYPVLIKASAGGGGRGMKVANNAGEVEDAYRLARSEAKAAFGNDEVYMEKYLGRRRHIEVQLLADGQGGSIHLCERACSLQRCHHRVLEGSAGGPRREEWSQTG